MGLRDLLRGSASAVTHGAVDPWPATGPAHPIWLPYDGQARPALVEAEQTGRAMVSVVSLRKDHVSLAKKFDKAGVSLAKSGQSGVRAQAVIVVDRSISMNERYANGEVQMLLERGLAFGLQIDVDGEIPVIPFGSEVYPPIVVNASNYRGAVDQILKLRAGSTNLTAALAEVRKLAFTTDVPLLVIVIADGGADDPDTAEEVINDLARFPAGICVTGIDRQAHRYLERLDKAEGRLVDNLWIAKFTDTRQVSDLEFADRILHGEPEPGVPLDQCGWAKWVRQAVSAGVLTGAGPVGGG